jgi:hypothetical protein
MIAPNCEDNVEKMWNFPGVDRCQDMFNKGRISKKPVLRFQHRGFHYLLFLSTQSAVLPTAQPKESKGILLDIYP